MAKMKLSIIVQADTRIGQEKALLLVPGVGLAGVPHHITDGPQPSELGRRR
jgi:hypothetical protein